MKFFRKLETRLLALPRVEHPALATSLPIFTYNGGRARRRRALAPRVSRDGHVVLGYGLRLTFIGVVVGVVGSYGLGRLLRSIMPRIAAMDLITFAGVAAVLFTIAVLACWIPARRATKVDPLVALRTE